MAISFNLFQSIKPFGSQLQTPTKKEKPFSRVSSSGRIVCEYNGFLPCTENLARHILKCEHLRQLPEENLKPFRVETAYTHQVWIWYRIYKNFNHLTLLFRGQFDFSQPGMSEPEIDEIAVQITDFVAHLMINAKNHEEVLSRTNNDTFWDLAIRRKLKILTEQKKSSGSQSHKTSNASKSKALA